MSHFQYIIPRKTKQGEMFQLLVTQKVDKLFILSATEREKLNKSFFHILLKFQKIFQMKWTLFHGPAQIKIAL